MKLWDKIRSVFTIPEHTDTDPLPLKEAGSAPPPTDKHTRTEHEKMLISDFKTTHRVLFEKLEDDVYDYNTRMKKTVTPSVKADFCRKTIIAYEKLRTVCINTGPGGALYFEDMWEHCSNSSNPDFRFIDPVEEILKTLHE